MRPQLGDFFVVRTGGWKGLLIRLVTRSRVNHAGVYVGDGMVVEGRPAGAGLCSTAVYPDASWSALPLTPAQRDLVVARALAHIGAPYSWVDCACIGLADLLGWHVPTAVRQRLTSRDRLMCSQLVDLAYAEAGIHLFADGRIPGDVSPGDLATLV